MTLQNYCGVLQVLSALQQTPVQRLKDTWKEVNPKSTKALQELGDIFQPLNNWRLARDLLHRNQPPSIPYIGARAPLPIPPERLYVDLVAFASVFVIQQSCSHSTPPRHLPHRLGVLRRGHPGHGA